MADALQSLNAEQRRVVEEGDGACLVLAGAGSGKTRTLVHRVGHLLSKGVASDEILLLTFTNKAAREMVSRLEELTGVRLDRRRAGTFHSVAVGLLRTYAFEAHLSPRFTILDADDAERLLKLCIKNEGMDDDRRFPSPSVLGSVYSLARNARRSWREVLVERLPAAAALVERADSVLAAYERRKTEGNALDFDDLLVRLHGLFLDRPDIRERVAGQFRFVLVDEYQDTSAIQSALVAQFASVHANVLVVGDDAQSIYAFRGADVGNILRFPEQFANVRTFRLEENYRSAPEILALANASIAFNEHQFEKALRAARRSGLRPRLLHAPSVRDEARSVVDALERWMAGGVEPHQLAVLFRSTYHSQGVEMELVRRGYAYELRGGLRFFERAHVKDVLAVLRVLENPGDEMAWMRLFTLQPGVGDGTATKWLAQVRGVPSEMWHEGLVHATGKGAAGWRAVWEVLQAVREEATVSGALRAAVRMGYADWALREYADAGERLQDIDELIAYAQSAPSRLQFLEEASLQESYGAAHNQEASRLVLSTIHQAKGLEWEGVVVIGLSDGGFPSRRSQGDDAAMEEERRLFYVAVTRAREHLLLTCPLRGMGEFAELQAPSCFVQEVPAHLLEQERPSSRFAARSSSVWDSSDQGGFYEEPSVGTGKKGGFLSDYTASS
jgi:DNA helicase-2/ATP-dependent DNA helicase PcrA